MTISTHTLRRLFGAAAVATCIAALGVPAALAGGSSGYQDGWYGYAVSLTKASTISRYGAPDGWYPYVVSLTKTRATVIDGRSPGAQTSNGLVDDSFRDASRLPVRTSNGLVDDSWHSTGSVVAAQASAASFQWGDFAIGIGVAVGSMLLLLGSALAVRTTRRPNKTRSTATA